MNIYLEGANIDKHKQSKLSSGTAIAFAEYLAPMKQCASAFALCKRTKPEETHQAMILLPSVFVSAGRIDAADYVASSLEGQPRVKAANGKLIDRYLRARYMMMMAYARKKHYVDAKRIIRETQERDSDWSAFMWCRLAESMARNGHYDKAMLCIDTVSDVEGIKERREYSLKRIKEYRERKANRHTHASKEQRGVEKVLQTLRGTTGVMTRSRIPKSVESIRERGEYISSIDDPSRRAALWREVAWNHWQGNRVELSRKAAEKCHGAVLRIPQPLGDVRVTESVLLADLYFVIGDTQRAISLVEEIIANQDEQSSIGFAQVLGSEGLMISVLVRARKVPTAFEIAKKNWDSEFTMYQWRTLGALCAFHGHLEQVEVELDAIDQNLAKAFLCLGVAYGLYEEDQESLQSSAPTHRSTFAGRHARRVPGVVAMSIERR